MEIPARRWRRIEGRIELGEEEERSITIGWNFGSIEELDRNGEVRGMVM